MKKKKKIENPQCYCGQRFNDYQKVNIRKSVCRSNPAKFQDEGNNFYCIFHYPNIDKKEEFSLAFYDKIINEDYFFYGTWFPFEVDFSNHIFAKFADFTWSMFNFDTSFENTKFEGNCDFHVSQFLKKVSFRKAVFTDNTESQLPTNFYSVTFENVADFSGAVFSQVTEFSNSKFLNFDEEEDLLKSTIESSFSGATFKEKVSFEEVIFGKEKKSFEVLQNFIFGMGGGNSFDLSSFDFSGTTFENTANFKKSEFWNFTNFSKACFRQTADFRGTVVNNSLNFDEAKFETFSRFSSKNNNHKSWNKDGLDFSNVEVEKPERIFFQTVYLKPDSFVNTDIRKFDFTDIKWKVKSFAFDWARFKDFAWWSDEARERKTSYKNLEKVYRRFTIFAEENNDYQSASDFRYASFDIQRITPWYGRLPVTLLWWYKWTSRYGENWLWCLILLVALVFAGFPYIYTKLNFKTCAKERPIYTSIAICESKNEEIKQNCTCSDERIDFGDAIIQSLTTATLQNVEYRKPMTWRGELWIILEKIFAPLQAALLALAIRRKFMR